jgi:hypothetical protein
MNMKQAVINKLTQRSNSVGKLYRDFHPDSEGKLSYEKFDKGLANINAPLSANESNELARWISSNSDQITFQDFAEKLGGGKSSHRQHCRTLQEPQTPRSVVSTPARTDDIGATAGDISIRQPISASKGY